MLSRPGPLLPHHIFLAVLDVDALGGHGRELAALQVVEFSRAANNAGDIGYAIHLVCQRIDHTLIDILEVQHLGGLHINLCFCSHSLENGAGNPPVFYEPPDQ